MSSMLPQTDSLACQTMAVRLAAGSLGQIRFRGQPRWKRAVDVCGAAIGLAAFSPLIVLATLVIRVGSRGPVFFRQRRLGANATPFEVWKFRTMSTTANQEQHTDYVRQQRAGNGLLRKLDRESVLIPFGSVMRCLAIDELPQLINVLRGEMSLVGPRPDVLGLEDYEAWQLKRFEVLPGLTGLWQVSGKNDTTFDEMMELDAAYVTRRSFWLDFIILVKTPTVLLRQALSRSN